MNEMDFEIQGLEDVEVNNTPVDEIDAEEVNLICTNIDQSGSMYSFTTDMVAALKEFKSALGESKEVDCMLVARGNFSEYNAEVGGYKKIDEFDNSFSANGGTPMYDAIVQGAEKLTNKDNKGYMDFLREQGMRVKSVFAVFSDGDDTTSRNSISEAKKAIAYLNSKEVVTAFISFGGGATATAKALGFKNILPVGSSASELRKAFNCLSKSVIESSKSVAGNQDDFFQI